MAQLISLPRSRRHFRAVRVPVPAAARATRRAPRLPRAGDCFVTTIRQLGRLRRLYSEVLLVTTSPLTGAPIVWIRCHDPKLPNGRIVDVPPRELQLPISRAAFEAARSCGWPAEVRVLKALTGYPARGRA